MSEYRDEFREIEKEARWSVFKGFSLFLIVIAILGLVGFVTHSLSLLGRTVVERVVFENSYQRTAARTEQLAIMKSALASIQYRLEQGELEESTRFNLESQSRALRVRIDTLEISP